MKSAHAFCDHDHIIYGSETEEHYNTDETDCFLCHLQIENPVILHNYDIKTSLNSNEFENDNFYNYYHNHQHLSYSLRAPPIF